MRTKNKEYVWQADAAELVATVVLGWVFWNYGADLIKWIF